MAEILALVGGGSEVDAPLLEVDPFLDTVAFDEQSPGFLAKGKPLQQLGELHRLQVARDSHRQEIGLL